MLYFYWFISVVMFCALYFEQCVTSLATVHVMRYNKPFQLKFHLRMMPRIGYI